MNTYLETLNATEKKLIPLNYSLETSKDEQE